MNPRRTLALLVLLLALASAPTARAACDTSGLPDGTLVAELVLSVGTVCFELLADDAPGHVDNFLWYLENGHLVDTLFHRSVADFVVQGGGFRINQTTLLPQAIAPRPGVTVTNEPCTLDTESPGPPLVMICSERGNERGTVALAKAGGDPNSGTTNWFVNLADNRRNLDNQNGGFTVFARVIDGMEVIDAMAALTRATRNDLLWLGSTFGTAAPANFTFTAPLRNPPLYGVAGQYGCFDPLKLATILLPPTFNGVADPLDPALFLHTLSWACGTPTTRATFVADPGPLGCTAADIIGVASTGPASPGCVLTNGQQVACDQADHFEFTCPQATDALALRESWRGDFAEHFVQQLVYIEAASVTTVPEPTAALTGLVACAALALRRKRNR